MSVPLYSFVPNSRGGADKVRIIKYQQNISTWHLLAVITCFKAFFYIAFNRWEQLELLLTLNVLKLLALLGIEVINQVSPIMSLYLYLASAEDNIMSKYEGKRGKGKGNQGWIFCFSEHKHMQAFFLLKSQTAFEKNNNIFSRQVVQPWLVCKSMRFSLILED